MLVKTKNEFCKSSIKVNICDFQLRIKQKFSIFVRTLFEYVRYFF